MEAYVIRLIRSEECERCAKKAEAYGDEFCRDKDVARIIAAAIRKQE